MDELLTSIAAKRRRLDQLRPLSPKALASLEYYYDIEPAPHETRLTESDVRNLHRLVMQRSAPEIAGQYADLPRYVRTETGRHSFPSPAGVPALMADFAGWFAA